MSKVIVLVSLLLIFIGEVKGGTTCGLHILDDADEATTGERLFRFLFFPYTSSERVNYQLCETSKSTHRPFVIPLDIWKKLLVSFPELLRTNIINGLTMIIIATFHCYIVTTTVTSSLRTATHSPSKFPTQETIAQPVWRKSKHRKADYKRDKLRLLKAQITKPGIMFQLMHLHKIKYNLNSIGKSERKSQIHLPHRYQSALHRRAQRYSDETLPKCVFTDLLNDGILCEKKRAESNEREMSFKDVREETYETLLKQKYDVDNSQTPPSISPEVRVGGGGDFVEGASIHSIGHPCASSSFISNFDADMIDPAEVYNNGEEFMIENNGNLSQGSFNIGRNLEQGKELNGGSPRHREIQDNSWTLQSFSDWMPTPSYLPNTPNGSFQTSFGAGTDRSMVFDDPGDESALMTTMMESFVSVSDSLQKTSTWYGSDDMEMSLFQWLSAVIVTKSLAQRAWTFLVGQTDSSPLYTSPPPRTDSPIPAAESPPSFSPQFQQTEYYPEFETELPRYEMVD